MKQLGQLFISGIEGLDITEEEKEFFEHCNIGGVIFFKENYVSPSQLAELVNKVQTCRDEYPLFISVDQEGGTVQRFKNQFSIIPSMYDISLLDSPKITFDISCIIAKELKACGINLNFSPVCDIWTNSVNKVIGARAFGKVVQDVEKHVSAAIRGFHTCGVMACAKHFPGHGDTKLDSHYNLPYVVTELDLLEKREMIPFIKASKSRVEFMMMAHLVVDAIDEDNPTTISAKAYKYLREKLKFDRIIITDDMHMGAIAKTFSFEEAAILAIEAGADILLYRDMREAKLAYGAVEQAISSGRLAKNIIQEKIDRVMAVKKNNLAEYKPIYIPDIRKMLASNEHSNYILEIEKKITKVKRDLAK